MRAIKPSKMRLLVAGLMAVASSGVGAQTACNGDAAFCNRKFSNVSLIGDHDSAFVGILLTDNQYLNVSSQLNSGIRFLQGQVHTSNGALHLCHTYCLERDAGPLVDYLTIVNTFMDANPNEIITLLLTNGDTNVPITTWGDVFVQSGISKYAFSPNKTLTMDEWPTLEQMIGNGTRLVTFMDYGADTTQVPYILDEFTYYFETPYDTLDKDFPECTIDRPPGVQADGRMYIVNHFLDDEIILFGNKIDTPDMMQAPRTNAATGNGSIGAQASLCESLYGRPPNVVLLDWADVGDWKTAQATLNGL